MRRTTGLRPTLILLLGPVAVAGVGAAVGTLLGYGLAFAWVVHFGLMAWIAAWAEAGRPALRGDRYRIRSWEPALHRALGVGWFQRLLRLVGWERVTARQRAFDGTRAGLPALAAHTRRAEFCHGVLAVVAVGLAGAALLLGERAAAGWLAALTVPLHGWPILLQRATRARIERITAAAGAVVEPV